LTLGAGLGVGTALLGATGALPGRADEPGRQAAAAVTVESSRSAASAQAKTKERKDRLCRLSCCTQLRVRG